MVSIRRALPYYWLELWQPTILLMVLFAPTGELPSLSTKEMAIMSFNGKFLDDLPTSSAAF